jgi:hypothetical protein
MEFEETGLPRLFKTTRVRMESKRNELLEGGGGGGPN